MKSSRIQAVLRSARELAEPVRISGLTPSASALVVARFLAETAEPVLVLCPDDDAAATLAGDLETLAAAVLRREVSPLLFPTWDQSAYSPITPSLRTRLARLAALAAVVRPSEGGPAPVVTTLAAACQATLPRAVFDANAIALTPGESVESREKLLSRLVEAGYLRTETVEDPGTFASRGDLVDVFPPGARRPLRVELFGDELERIREFDPTTQRTLPAELPAVFLPPAREVLINATTQARVREQLKARADDLGIPRPVRDPLLEAVSARAYPEHSDAWTPFAYAETGSLWDYLGGGVRILWVDELSCLQLFDEFLNEQRKLSGDAPASGLVLPPLEALFRWNPALEADIKARTRLYLDRLELAGLGSVPESEAVAEGEAYADADRVSDRHRVVVKGNSSLSDRKGGATHPLVELEPQLRLWLKQGFQVHALASTQSQVDRIRFLLDERSFVCAQDPPPSANGALPLGLIALGIGELSEGFRWPAEGLVVLTEGEITGTRHTRKQARGRAKKGDTPKDWAGLQALSDLIAGDAVVHVDHGIGRYQGLVRLELGGAPGDFLHLEYAAKDKLYLPIYRLNVIQKYSGAGDSVPLDRLGAQQFAKAKDKVRDAVKKLAIDLVQLYAIRKSSPGVPFSAPDAEYREFESRFAFDETPDQLKAIDDVGHDLESGRVMDRLVCGDVGYGKTEVAMRAAYRAVSEGKQVAVLVPTTVLATQHELSFRTRFKEYPIVIESLSRFKSPKEQKVTLEAMTAGKIDILIGTHRLLSKDILFHDLGLIIVDEEHRFGVEHKERLKTLKTDTHVLTLTATPIPRTLHMALSGLRDITLINTPPVDRLPIRTYVSKYDEPLIAKAIEFETGRGGQVFFLHNRVQSIQDVASRLRELTPNARVVVAHGQMAEKELEDAMMRFYRKEANVLVCTAIIESGLDIPSANTILINRADTLGLAQLYQIRGRVGRSQARGYAYLLIPAEYGISEDARRRLEVIQRFVELGSGFRVASHDLDIRGGGDLLGPHQSGHIAAVGFDLYTELLEEAIRELDGKPPAPEDSKREPEIKAPFPAFLSDSYVPDTHQRLTLYRRLSAAPDEAMLTSLEEELVDRFGAVPIEAQNLLWLIRIKQLLKGAGVDSLTVGPGKASIQPGVGSRFDPARAIALVSGRPTDFQLLPDSKFVARINTATMRDLLFSLETLFKSLMTPL